MTSVAVPSFDLSPTRLSYVAALRGVVPRAADASYTYAQTGPLDAESLICLAASNPTGHFYGLETTATIAQDAQALAKARGVGNISFSDTLSFLPEKIDVLCCDAATQGQTDDQRAEFFDIADKYVPAGGLCAYRYRTAASPRERLRFLIQENLATLTPQLAKELAADLKVLGSLYFAAHKSDLDAMDEAEKAGRLVDYFTALAKEGLATSGAFDAFKDFASRAFSLAGDADIAANYINLAAPSKAHDLLTACATNGHLHTESIKDFAVHREVRSDIWVRLPIDQSSDSVALFNPFTFGLAMRRENLPTSLTAQGGAIINLTTPLYAKLIDLMALMPIGIGDFLAHPSGKGFTPDEVVVAVQLLAAFGVAGPMRGRFEGSAANINAPQAAWAVPFNEHFATKPITTSSVRLASSIVGSSIVLPVREALVLQAIVREGLVNCAGGVMNEMNRLIRDNPTLAAQVMEAAEPNDEIVRNVVTSVMTVNTPRWYTYGLLAA